MDHCQVPTAAGAETDLSQEPEMHSQFSFACILTSLTSISKLVTESFYYFCLKFLIHFISPSFILPFLPSFVFRIRSVFSFSCLISFLGIIALNFFFRNFIHFFHIRIHIYLGSYYSHLGVSGVFMLPVSLH